MYAGRFGENDREPTSKNGWFPTFLKTTVIDHPHFLSNLCYTVFVELFRVSATQIRVG
jgi:hypothetical protein